MVSVKSKKSAKLTYAQRVIGAVSQIQKDQRKHALHLATIRAQVRKMADARKEKLGPQWAQHVNKAVNKLEEDGVLQRVEGLVVVTDDGRKSLTSARRSIPHTQSTEDVVWQYVSHNPPATTAGSLEPLSQVAKRKSPVKRNRNSTSPRKRPRFSTISTHAPNDIDTFDGNDSPPSTPIRPPGGRRKSVRISTVHNVSRLPAYEDDLGDVSEDPSTLIIPIPGVPSTSCKAIARLTKPELKAAVLHLHRLSLGRSHRTPSARDSLPSREDSVDNAGTLDDHMDDGLDRPLSPLTDIDSPPLSARAGSRSPQAPIGEEPRALDQTADFPTRPSSPVPEDSSVPTIQLPSPSQTAPSTSSTHQISAPRDAIAPSAQPVTRTLSGSVISPFSHQPTPVPSLPASPISPRTSLPTISHTELDIRDEEIAKLRATISKLTSDKGASDAALTSARTLYAEEVSNLESLVARLRGDFELTSNQLIVSEAKASGLALELSAYDEVKSRLNVLNENLSIERDGLAEELRNATSAVVAKESRLSQLQEALSHKDQQLASIRNDHSSIVSQLFEARQQVDGLNKTNAEIFAQNKQLLEDKAQLTSSIDKVTSDMNNLTSKNADLTSHNAQFEARVSELCKELADKQADLSTRDDELATLQEELSSFQTKLIESQSLVLQHEAQLNDLRGTVAEGSVHLATTNSKLSEAQSDVERKSLEIATYEDEITALTGRVSTLTNELAARVSDLAETRNEVASSQHQAELLQQHLDQSNEAITTLRETVNRLEGEIDEKNAALAQKDAEADTLNSMLNKVKGDLSSNVHELAATNASLAAEQNSLENSQRRITTLVGEISALQSVHEHDSTSIRTLKGIIKDTYGEQRSIWDTVLSKIDNIGVSSLPVAMTLPIPEIASPDHADIVTASLPSAY